MPRTRSGQSEEKKKNNRKKTITKRKKGKKSQEEEFGCFDADGIAIDKPTVCFSDVIGHEGAKKDLMTIAKIIKEPHKLKSLGARQRRGVLLVADEGLGKTMLAKAFANECKCKFILISASSIYGDSSSDGSADDCDSEDKKKEWNQLAEKSIQKIKHVFTLARKFAPSVIFFDEFDLLMKHKDQNTAELLTQLNGFVDNENDKVVVIAATNDLDSIDDALTRPGRFDRIIRLRKPEEKERVQMFLQMTKNKPLAEDVDFNHLAHLTAGFSGAEISNVCNEAALEAFNLDLDKINAAAFEAVLDREALGYTQNITRTAEEELRVAYHEGGHALVSMKLPETSPMIKVTIIPHEEADGVVFQRWEDHKALTKQHLENEICVSFGGMVGEQIGMGSQSIGSESDLNNINDILTRQIIPEGMLDNCLVTPPRIFSSAEFYRTVGQDYLLSLKNKTIQILQENKSCLDELAHQLVRDKTLSRDQVTKIIEKHEKPSPSRSPLKRARK